MIKQTKVAEHRCPDSVLAPFGDNYGAKPGMSLKLAKARRAWLEAKVAELKALPNTDARIINSGSYARVAEYRLTEVTGRIQIRGTCQRCGGLQALASDRTLVLHGYTRPGDGYTIGRCPGTGLAPAEIRVIEAQAWRGNAESGRAKLEQWLAQHPEPSYYTERDAWKEWNGTRQMMRALEHERIAFDDFILPRLGQPLTEVEVA